MRDKLLALSVGLLLSTAVLAAPPTPEEFLGFSVGTDRKLATYPQVLTYLRQVAAASGRVSIDDLGESTLGNEMVAVVLTSEENQSNLDRYREIARRLANADQLAEEEAALLIDEGKAIALVTCTIHSTEVGSTQMAMELVHDFATTVDPQKLAWMDEMIVLLMPSINPDGQVMVVDWYNEYLGTEFEGGRMPWLYHHYVGHDNNRDFYMLTQKESKVVNQVLYHRWFPQVFLDEHQMGSTGPRMFVPPQTDPLAPEIHSLIFRQADLIGTNMSFRLEESGRTGVGHNMIFDSYWPGGTRNTAWWKNVTGLLTEVASARIATPIQIDSGELRGGSKGLPEYTRRANFPSPWPGGDWTLRDIVDYELIATWALIETVSENRREFLRNFYSMADEAAAAGKTDSPSGWLVSPDQHDPVATGRLVELLLEHGVRVYTSDGPLQLGMTLYPAGTHVIPAAQPYRAFLLTMLRPQRYPEVIPYPGGPIFPPYDTTSWSLPIAMGVDLVETDVSLPSTLRQVEVPAWPDVTLSEGPGGYLIPHSADSAFKALNRLLRDGKEIYWLLTAPDGGRVGDIWLPSGALSDDEATALANELHLPIRGLGSEPDGDRLRVRSSRVGLFKPWVASMDEGWTRWVLEQYDFPFINLNNQDIKEGSFRGAVDVLLFPDVGSSVITKGEPDSPWAKEHWSPLPPEYSGGIAPEGEEEIKKWVEAGGTVVAMDSSATYFIQLFGLPVSNIVAEAGEEQFSAPGTMVKMLVDVEHPVGFGMRPEEVAYIAGSAAFQTRVPDPRFGRQVIARYPDDEADIPVSGYIKGAELLERRAAVVEYRVGEGRVVLIGFRPQHRAQTVRTFKLLFNSLYLPGLERVTSE